MKTTATCLLTILLVSLFCFTACKKSDSDVESSFTWNYKGVDYTAKYTYAHSIEDLGYNIIGGLENSALAPGSGPSFKIHPLQEGLYVLGTGEHYSQFIDTEGNSLQTTGILTITSVSNKRLSATFTVEVGSPGNQHTLKGTITNIPVTP